MKFSRLLHLAPICCFLLPFFYNGCSGPTAAEKREAENKFITDSIAHLDQALPDPEISTVAPPQQAGNNSTPGATPEPARPQAEDLSLEIIQKYPFLSPVLIPHENVYTGLAVIVDSFPFIYFLAGFVSFLLLIIGLAMKLIEPAAQKTTLLVNALGFVFFIMMRYSFMFYEALWGYWVCLCMFAILIIYDSYLFRLKKRRPE